MVGVKYLPPHKKKNKTHFRHFLYLDNKILIKESKISKNTIKIRNMPIGKVLVKDKLGNVFMVDKTDERYISGELVFFWKGRHHTEQAKENKRRVYEEKRYQDGEKNSQYGTIWITNDKVDRKIKKRHIGTFNSHQDTFTSLGFKRGRKYQVRKKVG